MSQTIIPRTREEAKSLAKQLIAIAGPARKHEVRVLREGPAGLAFEVPDEFAEQVGPVPDLDEIAESKPAGKAGGKASVPAGGGDAGGVRKAAG